MAKKRSILLVIIGMIFGCLLATGIFAVVTKSVSFNLALKVEPKIFFSMTLQVSNDNGGTWSTEKEIFNNQTGANVVNWATVNQNTIVLNQVLAGENLPEIANDSKLKLTVTNLTEKSADDAEEYLHLTLNYHSEDVKTFTMDNGYGIVNMEYGESTATQSMIITASSILADTYILIPFLAEIDEYRYTATITTENCEVVNATYMFKAGESFTAEFSAEYFEDRIFYYLVTIGEESYSRTSQSATFSIPYNEVVGNIELSVVVAIPVRDTSNDVWVGSIAPSFAGGTGTEESPFLIYNAKQLTLMCYLVDNYQYRIICQTEYDGVDILQCCEERYGFTYAYYKIMQDIVLNADYENYQSWNASTAGLNIFPTMQSYFKGVLDGNGFTIHGLYTQDSSGLMRWNEGTIKNLTLGSGFVNDDSSIGAFAAYNGYYYGGALIENCVNYVNVSCTKNGDSGYTGGIAGSNPGKIINCHNYGNVTGFWRVGGVTGLMSPTQHYGMVIESDAEIKASGLVLNCSNHGSVNAQTQNGGGVVGQAYRYGSDIGLGVNLVGGTIVNCFNTGAVVGEKNIGGVVGYADLYARVVNCYNIGAVSGTTYVGKVCGSVSGAVKDCYFLSSNQTDKGIGSKDSTYANDPVGMSSADMMNSSFARTLNDNISNLSTIYGLTGKALVTSADCRAWLIVDDAYPTLIY